MKRFLCIFLTICMCLSFALLFSACDEKPADQPPPEEPKEGQVLLNGVPLEQYMIVYPEGDSDMEEAAGYFAAYAKTILSVKMQSMSDQQASTEYELLLGNTNRGTSLDQSVMLTKDEYYIAPLAKKVCISGIFPTMMYAAIDNFLSSFVKVGNDMCFDLTAPKKGSDFSHLRIMTYNLLASTNNTNRDYERIDMVLDLIEKYEPDIFGVQEAMPNWKNSLCERFGDRYDYVGIAPHADGSGGRNHIFYLKSKFDLLDSGTRWLSETPDVPGSAVEGSKYIRIYTYAKLKDKTTGKVFLHVNTHLDNSAKNEEQALILMNEISAYNTEKLPCFITADFNFRSDSNGYKSIIEEGYVDSFDAAHYKRNVTDKSIAVDGLISRKDLIDHIFVTSDLKVQYYQLCTEKYARENGEIVQPSDHRPVFMDCVLP